MHHVDDAMAMYGARCNLYIATIGINVYVLVVFQTCRNLQEDHMQPFNLYIMRRWKDGFFVLDSNVECMGCIGTGGRASSTTGVPFHMDFILDIPSPPFP